MRDSYYQSAGNPLQRNRLPLREPDLEMLYPAGPLKLRLKRLVVHLAVGVGAALVAVIVYRSSALSWITPYDVLLPLMVLASATGMAVYSGQYHWLLHPVTLAAGLLLCLSARTSWTLQIAACAASLGGLVFGFGRHISFIYTASPVPRGEAEAARRIADQQLLVLAGAAAALVGLLLWSGSVLLKLALCSLFAGIVLIPRPTGLKKSRGALVLDGLLSWFTYDPPRLPGLLRSPMGTAFHRSACSALATALCAVVLVRWDGSPLMDLIEFAGGRYQAVVQELDDRGAGSAERIRYGCLVWGPTLVTMILAPLLFTWLITLSLTLPVVLEAAQTRARAAAGNATAAAMAAVRTSSVPEERESLLLGRVVADGTPVLVPRKVFGEHAHALGDAGSGKTSRFLTPLIEQLLLSGDCTVVVIDLKADTAELLASLVAAVESVRKERRIDVPLKAFTNQIDRPTHGFNPVEQPFWGDLDLYTQTDILCGATGLTYGPDYGPGYYSSANAAVLHHAIRTFVDAANFAKLAQGIGEVLFTRSRELHPEIRKAGVHVQEVMKRLGACEALNVTAGTGHAQEVLDGAIDLVQLFQRPHAVYLHLSAALSPSGAPEIARLFTYMLLVAATKTERKCPVFLVIDEFQRMVANNLEYMLQLARSMGVGIILANQSMEDLKGLVAAVEANCRLRQWFSISSSDDQRRLMDSSGLTVELLEGYSERTDPGGYVSLSRSWTEKLVPRLSINDILLASDHPARSILRISRGAGYAQYGGMPVIIESGYHISEDEYRRRKGLPWPELPGMFWPRRRDDEATASGASPLPPRPQGPVWTEEAISAAPDVPAGPVDHAAIAGLFAQSATSPTPPRRKGKKQK